MQSSTEIIRPAQAGLFLECIVTLDHEVITQGGAASTKVNQIAVEHEGALSGQDALDLVLVVQVQADAGALAQHALEEGEWHIGGVDEVRPGHGLAGAGVHGRVIAESKDEGAVFRRGLPGRRRRAPLLDTFGRDPYGAVGRERRRLHRLSPPRGLRGSGCRHGSRRHGREARGGIHAVGGHGRGRRTPGVLAAAAGDQ